MLSDLNMHLPSNSQNSRVWEQPITEIQLGTIIKKKPG